MGEMLRLNIGTAPIPGKVTKVKGNDVEVALIVGVAPKALADPATIDPPAILVPPV